MSLSISIIIVGGGLGGLATALSLAQKGHRVKVLESASQLTTIGGGIGIPPNSMRVMHHFGIAKRLHDAAEVDAPERLCFRRYTGELLCDGGSREKLYKYE
jgi:salicylate hydroxylase